MSSLTSAVAVTVFWKERQKLILYGSSDSSLSPFWWLCIISPGLALSRDSGSPFVLSNFCLENQLQQGMKSCNKQFPTTFEDLPSHGGAEDTTLFRLGTDFKMSQAVWFFQSPRPQITCQPGRTRRMNLDFSCCGRNCGLLKKFPLKGVIPLSAHDVVKQRAGPCPRLFARLLKL